MNSKDRDAARKILMEVEELSESNTLMNNMLKRLQEDGGNAKLFVYAGEEKTITELGADTAAIVIRDIIGSYNDSIILCKSKLEKIVRDTLVAIN